jgi:hypothetical protein
MQRTLFLLVVVPFIPRAAAAARGAQGPEFRASSDKTPTIVDQGGVR